MKKRERERKRSSTTCATFRFDEIHADYTIVILSIQRYTTRKTQTRCVFAFGRRSSNIVTLNAEIVDETPLKLVVKRFVIIDRCAALYPSSVTKR